MFIKLRKRKLVSLGGGVTKIRYSFWRIIGKDGVFVCIFLYPMNYNYLLERFKAFYFQISYERCWFRAMNQSKQEI